MVVHYATRLCALTSGLLSLVFTIRFILFFGASDDSSTNLGVLVLLIVSGSVLEAGKCICWYAKRHSLAHILFAAVLTAFSCGASVAFCVLQEKDMIERRRQQSADYAAYLTHEKYLVEQIESKKSRRKKHLSSEYHKQWQKAADLEAEISQLNADLIKHRNQEPFVGIAQANSSMRLLVVFTLISDSLGVSINLVKYTVYFLFSLAIEVMPVFMLTGVLTQKAGNTEIDNEKYEPHCKSAEIKRTIILKQVPPVPQKLIQRYGIDFDEAKAILEQLVDEGLLRKHGNVYKTTTVTTHTDAV